MSSSTEYNDTGIYIVTPEGNVSGAGGQLIQGNFKALADRDASQQSELDAHDTAIDGKADLAGASFTGSLAAPHLSLTGGDLPSVPQLTVAPIDQNQEAFVVVVKHYNGSDSLTISRNGTTVFSGQVTAASFSGDGSSLSAVNANQLGGHTSTYYATATALTSHTASTSNPHSTTAAQVGAYTTSQTDTALAGKANTSHTHAATDISSGTLADSRLSTNVPLKNATTNAFTGGMSLGNSLSLAIPNTSGTALLTTLANGSRTTFNLYNSYSAGNYDIAEIFGQTGWFRLWSGGGDGRLDLNAGQIYCNGTLYPQSEVGLLRSGSYDGTHTNTQAGSHPLSFQSSLVAGTRSVYLQTLASTSTANQNYFTISCQNTGGGLVQRFSIDTNSGDTTVGTNGGETINLNGEVAIKGQSGWTGTMNVAEGTVNVVNGIITGVGA